MEWWGIKMKKKCFVIGFVVLVFLVLVLGVCGVDDNGSLNFFFELFIV